jgi:hypothetical protein
MVQASDIPTSVIPTADAVTPAAETTLTLIDSMTRRVISVQRAASRAEALKIVRNAGSGHDAHISTPRYDELILCL